MTRDEFFDERPLAEENAGLDLVRVARTTPRAPKRPMPQAKPAESSPRAIRSCRAALNAALASTLMTVFMCMMERHPQLRCSEFRVDDVGASWLGYASVGFSILRVVKAEVRRTATDLEVPNQAKCTLLSTRMMKNTDGQGEEEFYETQSTAGLLLAEAAARTSTR